MHLPCLGLVCIRGRYVTHVMYSCIEMSPPCLLVDKRGTEEHRYCQTNIVPIAQNKY